MAVIFFLSGAVALCQMRKLGQIISRGPNTLTLPVLSFPIFQMGRGKFQEVSEVKEWIMELFKEHEQSFIKFSSLLLLLGENRARLMSQFLGIQKSRRPGLTLRTSAMAGKAGRMSSSWNMSSKDHSGHLWPPDPCSQSSREAGEQK